MVFELVTGEFLFDPKDSKDGNHTRDEDHLALMIELLGRMPKVPTLSKENTPKKSLKTLCYHPNIPILNNP